MVNITYFINETDNSLLGAAQSINYWTEGLLGIVIVIVLYIVSFGMLSRYGGKEAFAGASFIGALATILFRIIGFISNDSIIFISIAMVVLAAGILIWRKDKGT